MELFSWKFAFDKKYSEIIKDDFFTLEYLKSAC